MQLALLCTVHFLSCFCSGLLIHAWYSGFERYVEAATPADSAAGGAESETEREALVFSETKLPLHHFAGN